MQGSLQLLLGKTVMLAAVRWPAWGKSQEPRASLMCMKQCEVGGRERQRREEVIPPTPNPGCPCPQPCRSTREGLGLIPAGIVFVSTNWIAL